MSGWFDRAKRMLLAGARGGKRRDESRRHFSFESLEPRLTLAAAGLVPVGSQPTGPLTGKIVYLSPGHGYQHASGSWRTARGENNDMVEDFGTQDQASLYADYLFRAGATVVPMRPIGRQTNEVVLDNDMAEVTYTGSWSNSTGSRFYDEDYGAVADAVHYRFSSTSATETATATYTPNIPAAGFYPVYTWVNPSSNRTLQTYKVNHTGGQTLVKIDHSMVGNGWIYLGTYHFNSGSSATVGSVVISNQGTTGKVVIADAIRFGNGMGDVPDGDGGAGNPSGTVSGKPREDEASLMWVIRSIGQGINTTSFFSTTTSSDPNVSAPARLAEHMNVNTNPFGTSVYVAIHSNAADGTARGAIGLISNSGTSYKPTPNQSSLATYLARQINQDMRALDGTFEHVWSTRTTYTYTNAYGEINDDDFINSSSVVEMDATIVEVAFHDNTQDAQLMRDPKARDQIARSLYQGTLEYFDNFGGLSSPVSTPTPPTNIRVVSNASGQVTLNWSAGPTTPSGANGAAATGYRIYASSDGYGFDGGTLVSGVGTTTATLSGYDPMLPYYFKVVSVNAGGESKASEVVTALPSGGAKQILIVNGFDRVERQQDFRYTTKLVTPGGGNVTVDRSYARFNNSFDYVARVHAAINAAKPGVHVASTSNEAVISGAVDLNQYDTVIWILGTESTNNDTFDATEQAKVTSFINAGGNLFVSGSELAYDLDSQNNGRAFYEGTLKGNYVSNSAGTNTATVDAGGIFAGLSTFAFSSGSSFSSLDTQGLKIDSADVIAPQAGAIVALNYDNAAGAAAIQALGTGGAGNIVMFGFPFESMTNATRRQQAMNAILNFFQLSPPAPAVDVKTQVNGLDADTAPGPTLVAGSSAAFSYLVTNAGNVPLSGLVVKDNNGTPGNAADDFNATYSGGDTNGNSQLDVGETWAYSATRTVIVGQYTTTGTVTATGNAQLVSDSDVANYFGIVENADFNEDTFVDAADYILWRMNSGLTSGATHSQGDANSNGVVDVSDYNVWRSQFGSTIPAGGNGTSLTAALVADAAVDLTATDSRDAVFDWLGIATHSESSRATSSLVAMPATQVASNDQTTLLTLSLRASGRVFSEKADEESHPRGECDRTTATAADSNELGRWIRRMPVVRRMGGRHLL